MRFTQLALAAVTTILAACSSSTAPAPISASARLSGGISGGSGGGGGTGTAVDVIKVIKHAWATNSTLLVSASSSDPTARLYVWLPSGVQLGEIQNGGGGKYGGTVFVSLNDPGSLTITSSAGGSITVPTVPYQP